MLMKILYWTLLFFLLRNIWRVVRATKIITSMGKMPRNNDPFQKKSQTQGKSAPIEAEFTVVNKDQK